MSVTVNVRKI